MREEHLYVYGILYGERKKKKEKRKKKEKKKKNENKKNYSFFSNSISSNLIQIISIVSK